MAKEIHKEEVDAKKVETKAVEAAMVIRATTDKAKDTMKVMVKLKAMT